MTKIIKLIRTVWTADEIAALPPITLGMTFNDLWLQSDPDYKVLPDFPFGDKRIAETLEGLWEPKESAVHDVVIVKYRDRETERCILSINSLSPLFSIYEVYFTPSRRSNVNWLLTKAVNDARQVNEDHQLQNAADMRAMVWEKHIQAAIVLAIKDDLKSTVEMSYQALRESLRYKIGDYIYKSLQGLGISYWRVNAEIKMELLSLDDTEDTDGQIDGDGMGAKETRIEKVLYSREQSQWPPIDPDVIREAVKIKTQLSVHQQKFVGAYSYGCTIKEVGERLGITANAARKRLQRIREQVRIIQQRELGANQAED